MNGQIFASLNDLSIVYLSGNACIDKDFNDRNKLAKISQIVSANCGFTESDENDLDTDEDYTTKKTGIDSTTVPNAQSLNRIAALEAKLLELVEETQRNLEENIELKRKIYEMKQKSEINSNNFK